MTLSPRLHQALEHELTDSTALKRAELVRDLLLAVYDHVKLRSPEGNGLNGRDGHERQGLAKVVDAGEDYLTDVLDGALDQPWRG